MNKNSEHNVEKLLLSYLLGEAGKDEIKQVEDWLKLSGKNKKRLGDYEAVWTEAGKLTPNPVAVDSQSAWKKMSDRIDNFEKEKSKANIIPLRSGLIWFSTSVAAAILLIIGFYQIFLKSDLSIQNLQIASVKEIIIDTLPDGTNITLDTNSIVTYPERFAENERRMKLEGEAFFTVEPNKEKPFIIEAGNAFIEVLGTSFNVKAYKNSDLFVIVTEGKVKLFTVDPLSLDTLSMVLKAGESGKVSSEEKKPVFVAEQSPDAIFWMNNTLIFDDTDLKMVFKLLEKYYHVNIKVSDKRIYECRLSTTFSNNTIDEIIDVIVATFEFEFTKKKNIFTIKGDGCAENKI